MEEGMGSLKSNKGFSAQMEAKGAAVCGKERPLIVFCKMIACEIDRIAESVGSIREVTDRLVGVEAENEKISEDTSCRTEGEYGDLNEMLGRLRKIVDVLGYEAGRQSDRV